MRRQIALSAIVLSAACGGKYDDCHELRTCPVAKADSASDAPDVSTAEDARPDHSDVGTLDVGTEVDASADAGSDATDATEEDAFVEAEASVDAPIDHSATDAPPDRTPDVEAGPPLVCGGLNVGPKPTSFRSMDSPPLPMGGTITDGRYVLTNVVFYEDQFSYARATLDIRQGWFHRHYSVYSLSDDPLSGYEEIGTYVTTGGGLLLDVWMCGATMKFPYLWRFTSTPTSIKIFTDGPQNSIETIQTYELVDGG